MEIVCCVVSIYQVREIRDMLFLSTICTRKYLLLLFSRSKYIFLNEYDLLAGILFSTSIPRIYYPYFTFITWKISFSSSTNFYVLFGFSCQNSRSCSPLLTLSLEFSGAQTDGFWWFYV